MGSVASSLVPSLVLGIPVSLYGLFLVLAAIPYFQRHFVYAHKIHTLLWHNVNDPTKWGFAKNQVTPFNLKTVDGQSIYAWHILPLPIYAQHEDDLVAQPTGLCQDITKTENFKILRDDPESRLIISFHGNAGHIAQAIRPPSYHALTNTSRYHVLAIDYRGFGHSTGSPTETGVIIDATTAVEWATKVAGVPASRIVLLGQSLGTAVASATAEHFSRNEGIDFAGVVLVSGFSSLPTMLAGYAIAGWVPVLYPFRAWPWLLNKFMSFVVDKWPSADRLRETVRAVKARRGRFHLHLVHAKNDLDIPCHEDDKLFAAAVSGLEPELPTGGGVSGTQRTMDDKSLMREKEKRTVHRGEDAFVTTWKDEESDIVIRQELYPRGGHNDVMYYAPTLLAVMRAFDLNDQRRK